MYKITPEDRQWVDEFRNRPIGPHSPGLLRVLNAMRGAPQRGKYVLVCTKPHREWVLGRLPGLVVANRVRKIETQCAAEQLEAGGL